MSRLLSRTLTLVGRPPSRVVLYSTARKLKGRPRSKVAHYSMARRRERSDNEDWAIAGTVVVMTVSIGLAYVYEVLKDIYDRL